MDDFGTGVLGAWIALSPVTYVVRIAVAGSAFAAAMDVERVVTRVIGLVVLLLSGAGLFMIGVSKGTILDILLGTGFLGAAGYSWWFTRH
ncbi:MAG: hypothetical protein QM755_03950 [Luteolibacter sp.]